MFNTSVPEMFVNTVLLLLDSLSSNYNDPKILSLEILVEVHFSFLHVLDNNSMSDTSIWLCILINK